jgi:hypothetical protein
MRVERVLAIGVMVLLGAAPAAQAQSRQTFSGTFTTDRPGASSGTRLAIDYFDPDRPGGKPYSVAEVVQTFHQGTRIDTSVPPRCSAGDGELVAEGESACPPETVVGGGRIDVDSGAAVGSTPRVIENRVVFFNAEDELILFTESTNAGDPPIRTATRVKVEGGTTTAMVPPAPGAPPPDPFLAIKTVRVELKTVTVGGRPFIRTPSSCPDGGVWTNSARFTYRDDVQQLVESRSPCRRVGTGRDRRKPRIGVRGVPRRGCVGRAFRARVRIREASALRRATLSVDGRPVRRTRRKRFGARVGVRRLSPGRHRLTVTAVDRAGNRAARTVRFRRCG